MCLVRHRPFVYELSWVTNYPGTELTDLYCKYLHVFVGLILWSSCSLTNFRQWIRKCLHLIPKKLPDFTSEILLILHSNWNKNMGLLIHSLEDTFPLNACFANQAN